MSNTGMSDVIEYELFRLCNGDQRVLNHFLNWLASAVNPRGDDRVPHRHLAFSVPRKDTRRALIKLLRRVHPRRRCVGVGMNALKLSRAATHTVRRLYRDDEQVENPLSMVVLDVDADRLDVPRRHMEALVVRSKRPVLLVGRIGPCTFEGVACVEYVANLGDTTPGAVSVALGRCVNIPEAVGAFRSSLRNRSRLLRPGVRLFAVFFAIRLKMLSVRVLKRMYAPSGPIGVRDHTEFVDDMRDTFGWS